MVKDASFFPSSIPFFVGTLWPYDSECGCDDPFQGSVTDKVLLLFTFSFLS